MKREEIIAEARKWLGTPLEHHGRVMGKACDCLGLVEGVAQAFGHVVYDLLDYGPMPPPEKAIQVAETNLVPKPDGVQPVASDIVLLSIGSVHEPRHFAIIGEHGGRLTMIHASGHNRKVVEHTLSPHWRSRICRVYSFPGVED